MPIPYSMPPWVGQPADPAAHYQAGFQLGTHLGAQQAAQIFQQQQLARELQKDEFEAQKQNLSMQLRVDEAVRQHRATSAYQNMIASGVDPMEALKSVGPSMGIDPTRVMAMQEQRAERAAQQSNLAQYRQGLIQQREEDRAARIQQSQQAEAGRMERFKEQLSKKDTFESKSDFLSSLMADQANAKESGDRDAYVEATRKLEAAQAFLPAGSRGAKETDLVVKDVPGVGKVLFAQGSKQLHIIKPEASGTAFKAKWVPQFMKDGLTAEESSKKADEAWSKIQPRESATAPTPAPRQAPAALATQLPPLPQGKVYVRDQSGKLFRLPSDQLKAALDQGYIEVK